MKLIMFLPQNAAQHQLLPKQRQQQMGQMGVERDQEEYRMEGLTNRLTTKCR